MIINIQFLRTIATLMVVLFHVFPHYINADGLIKQFMFLLHQFGFIGVDMFFVISGFVIYKSSYRNNGQKKFLEFIYERAARIYLGYWPHMVIAIILVLWLQPVILERIDFIGSTFLTQPNFRELMIPVTWTLFFEVYFYLFFAFLLLFNKRHLSKILIVYFVAIVLVQLYGIIIENNYAVGKFENMSLVNKLIFSPFCLEFIMGCLIGIYFDSRRVKSLGLLFVLTLIFFGLGFYYQQSELLPSGLLAQGYNLPQRVFFYGFSAVFITMILIEVELRGKQLFPKFSLLMADAAYSIYLSHLIIIFVLLHSGFFSLTNKYPELIMVSILFYIFVTSVYSILFFKYIENPLNQKARALRNKLFPKH
ncbi:acyltransferase [Marinicella sp. S1101]|uniref:acyltransferase family protein n=1 Tax=Marinicella marina TaxID=2996016 RepID=UPI0022608509|nr:acyltransferase [Marinicella marina]MCX7554165.1 acyltransferase [Marinicella marina]MDJ1141142.1 acyltransferase [Marinicella marina]